MNTSIEPKRTPRRAGGIGIACLCLIALATVAVAQDYEIDWHAVAGGGVVSIGGDYELSGTVGQPCAGALSGGGFRLTGGFQALPPCPCIGDLNNDGSRDGQDVQDSVACMLSTGSNCASADLLADGVLDMDDVAAFVEGLLTGEGCQ